MFRWLQHRREQWAIKVLAEYSELRHSCPGAAYIFAATVRNAYELMDTAGASAFSGAVGDHIVRSSPPHHWPDFGMAVLALRMMRKVAAASPLGPAAVVAMVIREHGETYRGLNASDYEPTTNRRLVAVVGKHGTVGGMIATIEEGYDNLGGNREANALRRDEDIRTILADCDIILEVESGELPRYVSRLEALLP